MQIGVYYNCVWYYNKKATILLVAFFYLIAARSETFAELSKFIYSSQSG